MWPEMEHEISPAGPSSISGEFGRHKGLVETLALSPTSENGLETVEGNRDTVRLRSTVYRSIPDIPFCGPLSPVACPPQEQLCLLWIESYLGIDLDHSIPLSESLQSGDLLCRIVGATSIPDLPLCSSRRVSSLRLTQFREHAARHTEELFEDNDLLFKRNIPKVLRCIGSIARSMDPARFSELARSIPGAEIQWTVSDEPDEKWDGMCYIQQVVKTFRKLTWRSRLGIVIAGAQGSGKSATAGSLLGRHAIPPSFGLYYVPNSDDEWEDDEKNKLQLLRKMFAHYWPLKPVEIGAGMAAETVERCYVKVEGTLVQISELPDMCRVVEEYGEDGAVIVKEHGTIDSVMKEVQGDELDVLLLVERLDEEDCSKFRQMCRKIHRLYGEDVWTRCVVILTHGGALLR